MIILICILIANAVRINRVKKRTLRLETKNYGETHKTANWMTNLPENVKMKPLNTIKVVGSHDTAAYQFIYRSLPGVITGKLTWAHANFIQKFWGIGKQFLADWTWTSNKDVYTQLVYGVRAFDLRVTYDEKTDEFLYTHSLACDTIESVMQQILDFIKDHPKEIILIWSKPDWEHRENFTKEIIQRYTNLVKTYLNHTLIPWTDNIKTLQEYQDSGKQIIFAAEPVTNDQILWPYNKFIGQWNPTVDYEESYQFNLNVVENTKLLPTHFNTLSLTMSPNNEILTTEAKKRINPFYHNKDLRSLSQPVQEQYPKIKSDAPDQINNICVWWADFPTEGFIQKIIDSNL